MPSPPVLAITSGDPCGIGPEVILKALGSFRSRSVRLVILGDLAVFARTARSLRVRLPSWRVVGRGKVPPHGRALTFLDCAHPYRFVPGRSSRQAGQAALTYLEAALSLWRAGRIHGLVTAPVTKWAVQRVHRRFVGHTEYLAQAMKAREVAMMFASDRLRVVLLTRHIALRDVARAVDSRLVQRTLRLTARALQRQFGIRRPRIAVCGLNPHAGEGGLFGREEQRVLPVIRRLNRRHPVFEGPLAADGLFAQAGRYDAIVCWYHDQGLIPFKMAARDRGCQLTLGLPIVRTSPDHGSALDIAGRGVANPGSMRYALNLAIQLIRQTHAARF